MEIYISISAFGEIKTPKTPDKVLTTITDFISRLKTEYGFQAYKDSFSFKEGEMPWGRCTSGSRFAREMLHAFPTIYADLIAAGWKTKNQYMDISRLRHLGGNLFLISADNKWELRLACHDFNSSNVTLTFLDI